MSQEFEHKLPFKWEELDKEEKELKEKLFPGGNSSSYKVSKPGNVRLPKMFAEVAEKIYNFKVRSDDIWIVTYPKVGTTWTQEMLWQISRQVEITGAISTLFERTPFLEVETLFPMPPEMIDEMPPFFAKSIEYTENLPSPRVIKSHLPLEMLPPNLLDTAKVVYVCRNPKDTCVSFYHHTKLFQEEYNFGGSFEDYVDMFMKGQAEYGSYWYHLKDAWSRKDHPNLKFLWYEEMKQDLQKVIRDTSKFLGYHLTDLKVLQLDDFLYVDNYRKVMMSVAKDEKEKEKFKRFVRKGVVGDWKNHLTPDILRKFDNWVQENIKGTDIKFPDH